MPRRRRRFGDLNKALKDLDGNIPATGRLANYVGFLTGKRKITVANKVPAGDLRKRYSIALLPFAIEPPGTITPANRYLGFISGYSLNGSVRVLAGTLTDADFGWVAPDTGNQTNDNYFPALAKVTMTRSGAATDPSKTSGVTGDKYRYTPKRSFSLPFGRRTATAGTDAELVASQAIATGAADTAGVLSVGFEPEDFQLGNAGTKAGYDSVTPAATSVG